MSTTVRLLLTSCFLALTLLLVFGFVRDALPGSKKTETVLNVSFFLCLCTIFVCVLILIWR